MFNEVSKRDGEEKEKMKKTPDEWIQYELDFAEAKERFKIHGECDHQEQFLEVVNPYKCYVKLICCSVCNKQLQKVYLK
jgi:hypothetical protein